MIQEDENRNAFAEMLMEHRALRTLLEQIQQTLDRRLGGKQNVAGVLLSLRDQLQQHFAAEEAAGYFSGILHQVPWAAPQVEALASQHVGLVAHLEQLVGLVRGAAEEDCRWDELSAQFAGFSAELMRHEGQENELLQKAFTQDIGSKD